MQLDDQHRPRAWCAGSPACGRRRALIDHMPSSPTLLIASGAPEEIPVNRRYAESAADAQLWEIPEAGHTGGLRARPAEYERRVIDFLDYASTG